DRIAVIPHGPLFESTAPLDRLAARRQLGLPPDAELVLFAGLIEPYKGLDDLIVAFGDLAARRPQARLVIAGKPNERFVRYQQLLRDHRVLDRAILDLAFLPEPRLAAYLCAADVVVLPYRETTASGLLFAARRFGRPVVATAVGDLEEIVVDGESGLLAPASNPARLGEGIERLLRDPALAARLGAAGQRAAFGAESWQSAAERLVTFYQWLRSRS
ncbi:MAG: glycosyltransferase, partial [Chloroflexota bacterium]